MSFELALQIISVVATLWGVYLARLAIKKNPKVGQIWLKKKSTVIGTPIKDQKKRSFATSSSTYIKKIYEVNVLFTNPPFQKKSTINSTASEMWGKVVLKKRSADTPCIAPSKKSQPCQPLLTAEWLLKKAPLFSIC